MAVKEKSKRRNAKEARGRITKIAAKLRGHKSPPTLDRATKAGELRVDAVGAFHCESVLAALAHRGLLAPKDRNLNDIFKRAGERYASHWLLGYRIGVVAQDITRERSHVAAAPSALMGAAGAVEHAQQYRRAAQHLGPYFGAAVDAIVLNEEPVESVGRRISGYSDRNKAIAVAMDRLREGLSRLSVFWGMLSLDAVRTDVHQSCQESQVRPDGSAPSRALRTHRTFAGM